MINFYCKHIVVLALFVMLFSVVALAQSGNELKIFLVRHAPVDQKRPLLCTSGKAEEIYQEYNRLPIVDFKEKAVVNCLPPEQSVIYTSSMKRAILTAQKLYPQADTIIGYSLFDEYSLPMVTIPVLPLPYSGWTFLSRFLWMTRLNTKGESRARALKRMKQASEKLIELVEQRKTIVVVCHGYIIHDLRNQLKRDGWEIRQNGGNQNLAVTELVRIF